jgi:hypothetical protein
MDKSTNRKNIVLLYQTTVVTVTSL